MDQYKAIVDSRKSNDHERQSWLKKNAKEVRAASRANREKYQLSKDDAPSVPENVLDSPMNVGLNKLKDWARRTNDAQTKVEQYSPLTKPALPGRDRRTQTQMNFYKAPEPTDIPLPEPTTSQPMTAETAGSYLEYMRTNNLGKVSENFLSSLVNDFTASDALNRTSALLYRSNFPKVSQDSNMTQLQKLMEKSHRNPARSRRSVPRRDRKDWDLT